jgi:hypothetical protein
VQPVEETVQLICIHAYIHTYIQRTSNNWGVQPVEKTVELKAASRPDDSNAHVTENRYRADDFRSSNGDYNNNNNNNGFVAREQAYLNTDRNNDKTAINSSLHKGIPNTDNSNASSRHSENLHVHLAHNSNNTHTNGNEIGGNDLNSRGNELGGDVKRKKVVAVYMYEAAADTELDFVEGDVITVIKQDDSGWWQVHVCVCV